MAKIALEPLSGKYYGTTMRVFDDDGNSAGLFSVWLSPQKYEDYQPSNREVESWNEAENGPYEISDTHYETKLTYDVCKKIEETFS